MLGNEISYYDPSVGVCRQFCNISGRKGPHMNSQFADGNDESDDSYIEEDEESLYENLDTLEKLETII